VAVVTPIEYSGARAGFRAASVAKAAKPNLTPLFGARGEASLEGVLLRRERSPSSANREVVEQCIRVGAGRG